MSATVDTETGEHITVDLEFTVTPSRVSAIGRVTLDGQTLLDLRVPTMASALRHQITVLQRQLHGQKVRFTPADRALLAALLHRFPRAVLRQVRLVVRPKPLRWHRDLVAARHERISRPRGVGRPRTVRSIRVLVLRLAGENTSWG
jgi:hypothetical protein